MRRINLFVISLLVALPAGAEIYQWRDAQGRVHYSDTPPAGENATRLRPAVAPAVQPGKDVATGTAAAGSAEAAKPETLAERDLAFRQRRAEAAEAAAKAEQERQQSAERQRDCEQARNQLVALESGQRLARFNRDGEREVLGDKGRADEITRTQKFVESACR
ncbi:DUF4124 domain-containing protein [Aromatoleum anaerobium]|uniref:DUF4124 domain-containing protein n=1 Tax=Aromatoleum anaerobium TaxID=182180 RepID=A0ABX1PNE4_9RHOO|nr:DUF4124 domain-containing protein [Aromatoleum anaerobium]MCK0508235.1 DUF4124 domain-containing protein [Aromatoleum anaerobium]